MQINCCLYIPAGPHRIIDRSEMIIRVCITYNIINYAVVAYIVKY